MMKNRSTLFLFFLSIILWAAGCTNKSNDLQSDALTNYQNLQVGKYITYKLDSTVKIPLNDTGFIVHSYQAKDVVQQAITDNTGKPSWSVVRYLRNASSTNEADWQPNLTYLITPSREKTEVVEYNLRYIKMVLPIAEDVTWYGNKYLENSDPFADFFSFNNDNVMGSWQYGYTSIGATENIENKSYDDVITVSQVDQSTNYPVKVDTAYGSRDYGIEKYAKHIGLVYKELTMLEFQPKNDVFPHGYKTGFTLRMRITGHN